MSRQKQQVLRFAVGSPDGPRSRTWRLWVPPRKSDVYISSRRVASDVKVSLHEPGPSRLALTQEHVRGPNPIAVPGADPRGAVEWERPRPRLPEVPMTRPFAILVPAEEVRDRDGSESGDVVWTAPPAPGMCVEYDVMYAAAGLTVEGYPGATSMGTELVGKVDLANGEQVWVVSWEHELGEAATGQYERLRNARIVGADGKRMEGMGALAFGVEDGGIGMFLDVTVDDGPPEA
jgi:hypothetical protein